MVLGGSGVSGGKEFGKLLNNQIFHIFNFTVIKLFILSIITVRVMIAVKVWMDADTLVVFVAFEVFRVCAGKTAIARVFTRLDALMRVPVVTCVVVSNDVIKFLAIFIFTNINSVDSRAD